MTTTGEAANDANDAVDGDSTENDGIYVITVMVTDPTGELGGSTDTKVVVITATDVDEAPSVAGRDDATDPNTAHMVDEGSNLLEEDDLTNTTPLMPLGTWRSPLMMKTWFHCR